jgi:hypothetical protein
MEYYGQYVESTAVNESAILIGSAAICLVMISNIEEFDLMNEVADDKLASTFSFNDKGLFAVLGQLAKAIRTDDKEGIAGYSCAVAARLENTIETEGTPFIEAIEKALEAHYPGEKLYTQEVELTTMVTATPSDPEQELTA